MPRHEAVARRCVQHGCWMQCWAWCRGLCRGLWLPAVRVMCGMLQLQCCITMWLSVTGRVWVWLRAVALQFCLPVLSDSRPFSVAGVKSDGRDCTWLHS